jgi:hypothetical protein
MSGTKVEQFRITAWPGEVVPPPPCRPSRGYRLDEEHEVLFPLEEESPDRSIAPNPSGEIYLRLAEIDLSDPHAILDFVNRFNILGIVEARFPSASFHLPSGGEEALHESRVRAGRPLVEEFRREWEAGSGSYSEIAWEKLPRAWTDPDEAAFHVEDIETLTEFRIAARFVRDGLTAWRYVRGDLKAEDVHWESPYFDNDDHVEIDTQDFLLMLFDFALMPFHPGISFLDDDEFADEANDGRRFRVKPGSGHARQGLDLFPICCLELYNHIVEEAEYRACANETCGRLFVRQEGRSTFNQRWTTGVKYCSALCAKAQAQRNYRRRKTRDRKSGE